KDGIAFHPYYTVKDLFGVGVFLLIFCAIIFYTPEMNGYFLEGANFEPANPVVTPTHIAPVWYFGAFYSILRASTANLGSLYFILFGLLTLGGASYLLIKGKGLMSKAMAILVGLFALLLFYGAVNGAVVTGKQLGVILMFGSIIIMFLLPWLDRDPTKSIRYRGPIYKIATALFVIAFMVLTWLGGRPTTDTATLIAQILTAYYFLYFLVVLPILPKIDKCKPVPARVTK
ncbi:MAG: cytochrome bc complex cytochrome b subunit, partial [Ostreibacterium sp.]